MFAYRATRGPVEVAFTDRHGGVSGGPYASLNLAARRGDATEVEENLRRVVSALAAPAPDRAGDRAAGPAPVPSPSAVVPALARMHQVHGAQVHVVDDPAAADAARPQADAMVTALEGIVLLVRVADCVPLLLADVERRVVAAVHAGRPGLVAGVVPAAVEAMRARGAERIAAWVGPHVCGACYEVPEEMRADVAALVPESSARTSWGTPALDIGAGVRAQLRDAEVEDVVSTGHCTIEDDDLFSYRRQGPGSGRLGGLVWVRP